MAPMRQQPRACWEEAEFQGKSNDPALPLSWPGPAAAEAKDESVSLQTKQ